MFIVFVFQVGQGGRQCDFLQIVTVPKGITADLLQGFGKDDLRSSTSAKSGFADFGDSVGNGDYILESFVFHQGCAVNFKIAVRAFRGHGETERTYKQHADDKSKQFHSRLTFHFVTSFLCVSFALSEAYMYIDAEASCFVHGLQICLHHCYIAVKTR